MPGGAVGSFLGEDVYGMCTFSEGGFRGGRCYSQVWMQDERMRRVG